MFKFMVQAQLPEVMKFDSFCYENCWTERDFKEQMKKRNVYIQVYEYEGQIIGFLVYQSLKYHIEILRFGIHPDYQRNGLGKKFVAELKNKMKKPKIKIFVPEINLAAQLFFKSQDFMCTGIEPPEDDGDTTYKMEYLVNNSVEVES